MRDLNFIELDDYEIIDEPTPSQTLTPSTEHENPVETEERLTKELFEPPKETDLIRDVAKIVVALSLPFAVAWTTFGALLDGLYNHPSNEQLLKNVSDHVEGVLESYRKRLEWVDKGLSEYLEAFVKPHAVVQTTNLDADIRNRYKPNISNAFNNFRSATKRFFVDEPYIPIAIYLIRGFWSLMIYLSLRLAFPKLPRGVRIALLLFLAWVPLWTILVFPLRWGRYRPLPPVREFRARTARGENIAATKRHCCIC